MISRCDIFCPPTQVVDNLWTVHLYLTQCNSKAIFVSCLAEEGENNENESTINSHNSSRPNKSPQARSRQSSSFQSKVKDTPNLSKYIPQSMRARYFCEKNASSPPARSHVTGSRRGDRDQVALHTQCTEDNLKVNRGSKTSIPAAPTIAASPSIAKAASRSQSFTMGGNHRRGKYFRTASKSRGPCLSARNRPLWLPSHLLKIIHTLIPMQDRRSPSEWILRSGRGFCRVLGRDMRGRR